MSADGRSIHIGPPRRRSVLAILLVEANQPVRLERLVDRVWGDRPPASAQNVLASHIARLRTALAGTGVRLPRGDGGYRLEVDPDRIDLHVSRVLLRQATVAGDDATADGLVSRALALWRGDPFTGTTGPWLPRVRDALFNQWLVAVLDHAEYEVRLGRPAGVVGELIGPADRHPLDERILGQLMVALSRTGRRAEALERQRGAAAVVGQAHGWTSKGSTPMGWSRQASRARP